MDLEALQAAIRGACPARVWSQGVRLVRDDAVAGESEAPDEVVLRVKVPGRAVAATVVLYVEDEDWECDCPNSEDTCAHICAAIIALVQARKDGASMPTSAQVGGKVRYYFSPASGSMALRRVIVDASGAEHPVAPTLAAITSGRVSGPAVSPEQRDLNADRLLGTRASGRIPADRLENLLIALAGHEEVFFDGERVSVSDEVIVPHAVVSDTKQGYRFVIDRDPRVSEVLVPGVVRCGSALHRMGQLELSGSRLERLPIVESGTRAELSQLLEQRVPALARLIPVDIKARKLPEISRTARPDIEIELQHDGQTLAVMATLVYVEPSDRKKPLARVHGNRLVHLSGPVPARDEAAEKRVLQRLRDKLNLVPGQRVKFEGRDIAGFQHKLAAWNGTLTGDKNREQFRERPPLVPRLSFDEGSGGPEAVDIRFVITDKSDQVSGYARAADVLQAWREGDGLVVVRGVGGAKASWAPVPDEWLEKHGHLVADILAGRDERGRLAVFAQPDLARLCEVLEQPAPATLDRLAPLAKGFTSLPKIKLPGDLTAELRPYQRDGVRWLTFLRDAGLGALLADDMGLGKTLQTLCVMRAGQPTLVVCPTSVVHNWASELRRFRPGLRFDLFHGPRRNLDTSCDVVITSYALLRIDIATLSQVSWSCVVLDEAQAIKNPQSQVARAAMQLEAGCRVALSGTPVENRLDELWSLFHFTNRGLLGSLSDFRVNYSDPIARGDGEVAARLRTRIRPFLLRRRKRDVAPELPPRTDVVMHCELSESERARYDAVRAAAQKDIVNTLAQGGSVLAALEALLRLRQAACHPALLPGVASAAEAANASSKVRTLVDALELVAAEDGKALVFSQWTSMLDLIEPHLSAVGIDFVRLDGSTRDRAGVVNRFQDEAGPPVMLLSLKAGGTGLNLTAADHVFLCDPWWNPAAEDQAADRAHRIGQERPVMVYRLVSQDTVEERILALQETKRGLADAALGDAERAAGLTRDDLLALLA